MATDVLLFLSFHEPRRLRLPLQPIPPGANPAAIRACVFDDEATDHAYHLWLEEVCGPYSTFLGRIADAGATLFVSLSGPLAQMLARDDSPLAEEFKTRLRHPGVVPVSSDAANSVALYLDVDCFREQMKQGRELSLGLTNRLPLLAVSPISAINNEVYQTCKRLGFAAIFADGSDYLLRGRDNRRLYRNGMGPALLVCDGGTPSGQYQVAYAGDGTRLARRIADDPARLSIIAWRAGGNNRSGHCWDECATLEASLEELLQDGVRISSPLQALASDRGSLPGLLLPALPAVAAEFGDISFFFSHPSQQTVFCLMRQAYNVARLTGCQELVDLAIGMAQWDVLELLHHLEVSNGTGKNSSYFAADIANVLSRYETISQLHAIYEGFVRVVTESYL